MSWPVWALQELIELEAVEAIGADRWERSPDRVSHRNGCRSRVLSTKAGDLQVGIPKFRKGSFFPEILEPRRRIDQALYAVVREAYVNGVSTRSVDDLVAAMGIDTGISKSEVSRIYAGLDERVAAFRNRTLGLPPSHNGRNPEQPPLRHPTKPQVTDLRPHQLRHNKAPATTSTTL